MSQERFPCALSSPGIIRQWIESQPGLPGVSGCLGHGRGGGSHRNLLSTWTPPGRSSSPSGPTAAPQLPHPRNIPDQRGFSRAQIHSNPPWPAELYPQPALAPGFFPPLSPALPSPLRHPGPSGLAGNHSPHGVPQILVVVVEQLEGVDLQHGTGMKRGVSTEHGRSVLQPSVSARPSPAQPLTRVSGLRFLMMGFSLTDRWCWYPLKMSRWFTESPTRWMLAPITKVMMLT